MTEVWLSLSSRERSALREALAVYRGAEGANLAETNALDRKLAQATPYPDITIGVHGGQVQWTSGNPFPVRICDYDGDERELPDVDESGERCRIWFEPSDLERERA
jgi:hypothetical protein